MATTVPYRLVSRQYKRDDSIVQVGDVYVGGKRVVFMAGPCTIEDKKTLMGTAAAVKRAGARVLRGGAFKTRTSPYSFQGLGEEALKLLAEAGKQFGMPTVTEVTDAGDIEMVARYADMLQIGSRNMQNTALLKAVGRSKHPVLLKRGFACTINEWLLAAEYILTEGNDQVVLCERGIRTFENSTRFSLDILSIPIVKSLSHLPVIVDPSHAAGQRSIVTAASRAAMAAGADGILIEVSTNPDAAIVDGQQTLTIGQFTDLVCQSRLVAEAIGKTL